MKTILLLALVILGVNQVSAQEILKSIGGAAKNKVEQQDFNTTRSNKERNSLLNKRSSKQGSSPESPSPASPGGAAAGGTMDVDSAATEEKVEGTSETPVASGTYKQEYSFGGKISYKIEDLKKAKESTMSYYYSEGALWMLNDAGGATTSAISDYENEVMIMLNDKDNTAMVMSMEWSNKMAGKMADNHQEKVGKTTVTKTGATKVILGYTCTEYLATNEDGSKTDFWVTTEAAFENSTIAQSITKNMKTAPEGEYGEGGLMMEFTSYNKKSEAEMHMIMTEFNKDAVTKSLAGYKVTVMPGM